MALHAMLHRTQTAAQRSMVQRGSQGKMVRCRVTGQKAACRLAVWMTVMKHTLRPWAQRRMLRRKLPLRAARWFWQKQRQQRMGCARKHRQQGRVLRQWGRRQLLRQARTVPHRLAAEMQADRANTAKANSTGRGVAIIDAASKKVTIRMCFTDGILTKKQSRSRRSSVRWERLLSAAKSSQWISVKFATSGQS